MLNSKPRVYKDLLWYRFDSIALYRCLPGVNRRLKIFHRNPTTGLPIYVIITQSRAPYYRSDNKSAKHVCLAESNLLGAFDGSAAGFDSFGNSNFPLNDAICLNLGFNNVKNGGRSNVRLRICDTILSIKFKIDSDPPKLNCYTRE